MSRTVNRVTLLGHLGQDPELKYTPSGQAVVKLRLATSDRWKDKNNEWQDRTEWHTVVLWARLAETASQYLTKGSGLYIEGRLQTHSWDDKEGRKHYATEIIANEMVMLGGRGNQSGAPPSRERATTGAHPNSEDAMEAARAPQPAGPEITDDDIPF